MPADLPAPRLRPLLLALAASLALVLSAPFIGEIRRAVQQQFPAHFVRIIVGCVAIAVAFALIAAVRRIRDRRLPRYGGIVLALVLAASYSLYARTGDARADAVEQFHFVEYGLITLLFYRAWRPLGDGSILLLPILAGLVTGTLEEWYQWLIPARVGEVRDVFLNLVAIACGLIFSVAYDPPDRFHPGIPPGSRRRVSTCTALLLLVFAGFFQSAHLGYLVTGEGWQFRSGHTAAALDAAQADRAARWRGQHIGRPARLSIEDQYLTEGHQHVARRNTAWTAGEVSAAWFENLILERYFAPVLDTPSYLSPTGHRWAAEHREDAARRVAAVAPAPGVYDSTAHASAILLWSKPLYWTIAIVLAALLAAPWRRRSPRAAPAAV